MDKSRRRWAGWRVGLPTLWGALVVAAFLVGCGAADAVTNFAPTAQAAAGTAQAVAGTAQVAAATAFATAVPPGAGATAQALAATAAAEAPGVLATAAAAAPTIRAGAGGLVPTARAYATQAAGSTGGPEATISGRVVGVDVPARTFSVRAADGQRYDFIATTSSQVDFGALANNLATTQEVTVTYRNTTAPYEVIGVR